MAPRKKKEEVKEEIAAPKKRGRKAVAKKEEVKEETATPKRRGRPPGTKVEGAGRKKGVRYEVSSDYSAQITDLFEGMQNDFDDFGESVEKFLGSANKAAVLKARKAIQEFTRKAKDFRKVIQDAKMNMVQVEK